MINSLFGNSTAAKVLLYIQNYGSGYASAIAETFGLPLFSVQKQLNKLEQDGFLVCQEVGRTKVFQFNPRNVLSEPLRMLLQTELDHLPDTEKQQFFLQRRRPRRQGKPL